MKFKTLPNLRMISSISLLTALLAPYGGYVDDLDTFMIPATSSIEGGKAQDWEDVNGHSQIAEADPILDTPQKGDDTEDSEGYIINFNNLSIIEVIRFISKISGTNFIFNEEELDFKVTIVSEGPTSIDNIMTALLQILRIHNLSILQQGNAIVIHQNKGVITPPKLVNGGDDVSLATRLFKVHYLTTDKLSSLIKPYLSDDALINTSPETGHILITDINTNIEKIAELLKALDAPNTQLELASYQVKNLNITMLMNLSSKILEPLSEGARLELVPQPVSNSIFIVSTPYLIQRALVVLETLDEGKPLEDSQAMTVIKDKAKTDGKKSQPAADQTTIMGRRQILIENLEKRLLHAKEAQQTRESLAEEQKYHSQRQKTLTAIDKLLEKIKKSEEEGGDQQHLKALVTSLEETRQELEKQDVSRLKDFQQTIANLRKEVQKEMGDTHARDTFLKQLQGVSDEVQKLEGSIVEERKQFQDLVNTLEKQIYQVRQEALALHGEKLKQEERMEQRFKLVEDLIKALREADHKPIEDKPGLIQRLPILTEGRGGGSSEREADILLERISNFLDSQQVSKGEHLFQQRQTVQEASDELVEKIQKMLEEDRQARVKQLEKEIHAVSQQLEGVNKESKAREKQASAERVKKLQQIEKLEEEINQTQEVLKKTSVEILATIKEEVSDYQGVQDKIEELITKLDTSLEGDDQRPEPEPKQYAQDLQELEQLLEKDQKLSGKSIDRFGSLIKKLEQVIVDQRHINEKAINNKLDDIKQALQSNKQIISKDQQQVVKLVQKIDRVLQDTTLSLEERQKKLDGLIETLKDKIRNGIMQQLDDTEASVKGSLKAITDYLEALVKVKDSNIEYLSKQLKGIQDSDHQAKIKKELEELKQQQQEAQQAIEQIHKLSDFQPLAISQDEQQVAELLKDIPQLSNKEEVAKFQKRLQNLQGSLEEQSQEALKSQQAKVELTEEIEKSVKQATAVALDNQQFTNKLQEMISQTVLKHTDESRRQLLEALQEMRPDYSKIAEQLTQGKPSPESTKFKDLLQKVHQSSIKGSQDTQQMLAKRDEVIENLQDTLSALSENTSTQYQSLQDQLQQIKGELVKTSSKHSRVVQANTDATKDIHSRLKTLQGQLEESQQTLNQQHQQNMDDLQVQKSQQDFSDKHQQKLEELLEEVRNYKPKAAMSEEERQKLLDDIQEQLKEEEQLAGQEDVRRQLVQDLENLQERIYNKAEESGVSPEKLEDIKNSEADTIAKIKNLLELERSQRLDKHADLRQQIQNLQDNKDKILAEQRHKKLEAAEESRQKLIEEEKKARLMRAIRRKRADRKSRSDGGSDIDFPEIDYQQQDAGTSFFVYKLEYQDGAEIVSSLHEISEGLGVETDPALRRSLDKIQYLPSSNAILISGTKDVLKKIRILIANMDIPIRQVFIEMLVVETTIDNSLNFGVQWGVFHKGSDGVNNSFGSWLDKGSSWDSAVRTLARDGSISPTTAGGQTGAQPVPAATEGFNLGIIGRVLSHGDNSFTSLGALVKTMVQDSNTNIILNPQLVTEENNTAEIFVGEQTRYKASSVTQTGGNVETTYTTANIGTTLKVTPRLGNRVDVVTLDIEQNVSDSLSSNEEIGPITRNSITSTRVHIPDQNFLIMSGMIHDKGIEKKSSIPCLGAIPVLGAAFKDDNNSRQKRNLMIFIRPHILSNEEDIKALTESRRLLYKQESDFDDWHFEVKSGLKALNTPAKKMKEIGRGFGVEFTDKELGLEEDKPNQGLDFYKRIE
ncbi:MAG: secretin N-terminal domain-containing protein [Chlamydiota bacterium]